MMKDDGLNELRKSFLGEICRCFAPWQWFLRNGEPDPEILENEVIFMWVYRPIGTKFHVGYFMPDGTWFTDVAYEDKETAVKRVNYLNGGHVRERGEG